MDQGRLLAHNVGRALGHDHGIKGRIMGRRPASFVAIEPPPMAEKFPAIPPAFRHVGGIVEIAVDHRSILASILLASNRFAASWGQPWGELFLGEEKSW
jgi:hypothetical protein